MNQDSKSTSENLMKPTAPPRIIRRPAADGQPARFEAAWAPDAPATPRQRLMAAQQKRRQRGGR